MRTHLLSALLAAIVSTSIAAVVDRDVELARIESLPAQVYEFSGAPASEIVAAVAGSAKLAWNAGPGLESKWTLHVKSSPGAMIRTLETAKIARFELLDTGTWLVSGVDPTAARVVQNYPVKHGDKDRLAELAFEVARVVADKGSAIPDRDKMQIVVTAPEEVQGWVKTYLAGVDIEIPKSAFSLKFSGVNADSVKTLTGTDGRSVVTECRVQPPADSNGKQAGEILISVTFVRYPDGQMAVTATSRQLAGVGAGNTPLFHDQRASTTVRGDECVLTLPPVTVVLQRILFRHLEPALPSSQRASQFVQVSRERLLQNPTPPLDGFCRTKNHRRQCMDPLRHDRGVVFSAIP